MTGYRIGWACGNSFLVNTLLKVKSNIDSGIFGAVQETAINALENETPYVKELRKIFKDRRDFFVNSLKDRGFKQIYSDSTFYVWCRIPVDFKSSVEFSKYLIEEKNIIATPGIGFGKHGEGFIRFALTVDKSILKKVFI